MMQIHIRNIIRQTDQGYHQLIAVDPRYKGLSTSSKNWEPSPSHWVIVHLS